MPDIGGAVTRLINLLNILNSLGYKITIVTTVPHYPKGEIPLNYKTRWKFIEESGRITVIRLKMPSIPHDSVTNRLINYLYFVWASLIALPSIGKVDIIWVTSPNFFGNITGIVYKIVKRAPLILNVDDLWPDVVKELKVIRSRFLIKIADLFNNFAFTYCDRITPISPMLKRKLTKKYHLSSKKIHVLEVGVNYQKFRTILKEPRIRNENNEIKCDKTPNLIVYSGILGYAYDFNLLLRVAKILEKEINSIKLIIHGKGELESYIRAEISKLGLNNTELITKYFNEKEYLEFLHNASIFVLPLRKGIFSETAIPTKLFTYLLLDKPIISTVGGDVEIILKNSKAGVAVSHNYKKFAKVIKSLILDDNKYLSYCGNGSYFVEKYFSLSIIKRKIIKLLKDI